MTTDKQRNPTVDAVVLEQAKLAIADGWRGFLDVYAVEDPQYRIWRVSTVRRPFDAPEPMLAIDGMEPYERRPFTDAKIEEARQALAAEAARTPVVIKGQS